MKFAGLKVFLFGSILSEQSTISDVDVLVLYESEALLPEVKSRLAALGMSMPIDVMFMTFTEEQYLDFVKQQGAQLVEVVANNLM